MKLSNMKVKLNMHTCTQTHVCICRYSYQRHGSISLKYVHRRLALQNVALNVLMDPTLNEPVNLITESTVLKA